MNELYEYWFVLIDNVGIFGLAISGMIIFFYQMKFYSIQSQIKKYAFASNYEVKVLKTTAIIFSMSITLFLFDIISRTLGLVEGYEFYFVAFVSIGIGILIGYTLYQYFKFYYPFILERKLSKIRFKPRLSPNTGKPMRLLNELEEDVHLTEEMIGHELAFTYDYDVWLDDDTGYKLIERFDGHLHTLICPKCNFRTMKDYKEDVVKSPSISEEGLLKKHFQCSYCEHSEIHDVKIASLRQEQAIGAM